MSQWGKKSSESALDLNLRIYKFFDSIVMLHDRSRNQEVNLKQYKVTKNLENTVDRYLSKMG